MPASAAAWLAARGPARQSVPRPARRAARVSRAKAGGAPDRVPARHPLPPPPRSSRREAPLVRARHAPGHSRPCARGLRLRARSYRLDLPPPRALRARGQPHASRARPRTLHVAAVRLHQEPHPLLPRPRLAAPPLQARVARGGSSLREFPPVLSENRIFQLTDDGVLSAVDKYDGKTLWSRTLGALSASSPAVDGNTVYATVLARATGSEEGRVVALDVADGAIRWSRNLPSRSESSPLLDRGRLYFGSEDGTVYALEARTGRTVWTYHAAGAVKASPTLSGGVLYFGDYSGHVQ